MRRFTRLKGSAAIGCAQFAAGADQVLTLGAAGVPAGQADVVPQRIQPPVCAQSGARLVEPWGPSAPAGYGSGQRRA